MKSYNPELVMLSGEDDLRSYLEPQDYELLSGDLGEADIAYLSMKYPELMGVWGTILKVVGKGAKRIGKGIFRGIRKKRKRKKRKAAKRRRNKARKIEEKRIQEVVQVRKQAAVQAQIYKKSQTNKNLMIIGAAGIGAAYLFMKKK